MDGGYTPNYDYALEALTGIPYGKWREYDAEDTVRFFALRLHEVGLIKSTPQKLIAQGTFREDLYYRLNVIEIAIPPLNQNDITTGDLDITEANADLFVIGAALAIVERVYTDTPARLHPVALYQVRAVLELLKEEKLVEEVNELWKRFDVH